MRRGILRYESRAGARTDADVVVGEAHVQRLAVGLGVDGDGLDAELAAGANDAQRDLAAIGDQDFLEHVTACDASGGSTSWLEVVPARVARAGDALHAQRELARAGGVEHARSRTR